MNTSEDLNKIDRLKRALYSRGAPDILRDQRGKFHEKDFSVKGNWSEDTKEIPDIRPEEDFGKQKRHISFVKVFFAFSILFFLAAAGYAGYTYFNGGNTISAGNVDITISGPTNVSGGDPVSFDVQVFNKNTVKLEVVDLTVEYPDGTANADNSAVELKRYTKILGDIDPGGFVREPVKAIFFGEEHSKKDVNVKIEYRVANSNAILTKNATYEFFMQSSPVTLTISGNTEANSGQDITVVAKLTSNSDQILKNVLLVAQYPFGFNYKSADIKPAYGNNTWSLGDMPPKGTRTVKITGQIVGQDDEQRIFRFNTGTKSSKDEKIIGTAFVGIAQSIHITKPFISASLALDADSSGSDYIVDPGQKVDGILNFQNNLPTNINNAEIKLTFAGNAFMVSSVDPVDGLYRATDKTITWNRITSGELTSISPGDQGKLNFHFFPMDIGIGTTDLIKNPEINLTVNIKGTRASESNVPETINSSTVRKIKISPRAIITGQVFRTSGPFANSGPIPPHVDQKTTYTIMWTLTTTSSNIGNTVVVGQLPSYVDWTGSFAPVDEDITFSPNDKKITWKVGRLPAYTGIGSFKKQISFQIAVTPTLNQVGEVPPILEGVSFSGIDEFTGNTIQSSHTDLTTKFSSDSTYNSGDELIAK
ncbi:MAG: hypothetical protein NTV72_00075 [Candidatus Taylorbacteria bacterium]|nr:hypothetical protein [Candidatus Taylorbacteria bacterium]